MLYDIKEIQKVLPHRYPFLLIDRVESITDNVIVCTKCVSANEPFFQGHFPGEPIMPGVLQLEAIAQAGAFYVLRQDAYKGKIAVFASAKNVKWKRIIVPGDVLTITVTLTAMKGVFGFGNGEIRVDGDLACQAEIAFSIK